MTDWHTTASKECHLKYKNVSIERVSFADIKKCVRFENDSLLCPEAVSTSADPP